MEHSEFWISVKELPPLLSSKALRILIAFATFYLCKARFSVLSVIKNKYRSKINVEQEMRKLCSKYQVHPSH